MVELCQALLHLIKYPNATVDKLVKFVPGPDFPTGGVIVEPRAGILDAYKTGRGGFRLRAKWQVEPGKRGTYQIIVTEIPYQTQKGRIIEKISELLQNKKLPLLSDVWDESAEDIRLVLEPKSGKVEAEMLMEHLFKLTELETRVSLNLNVLDANQTPRVMSLREALQAYLDHRLVVLRRRTDFRLAQIARRLEILDGYLICYLNLDEIIRIIREEDEPKKVMMKTFKLTDLQAEAILNMRLRALRRLEEMEIRNEHKALKEEQKALKALMKSERKQWAAIADEIRSLRDTFKKDPELGPRRSQFADAPTGELVPLEAMIEREPITVVCSDKGWIRALKGHVENGSDVKYKDGDKGRFWLHAQTTDKLLIFATNGRFYTIGCDKLPGGRGHGEPVRLMIDLGNDQDVIAMFVAEAPGEAPEKAEKGKKKAAAGRRFLVASSDGRGFVVPEASVQAQTKNGKQVLNVAGDIEAVACAPVEGDHVAVVGDNHKLNIFPLDDLPEMNRGRGVVLQKYKDGGLADAKCFELAAGLQWKQAGGRTRTEHKLEPWLGKRANAGRLAPKGFPRNNRFG